MSVMNTALIIVKCTFIECGIITLSTVEYRDTSGSKSLAVGNKKWKMETKNILSMIPHGKIKL